MGYAYRPLANNSRQIRLLVLRPWSCDANEPIELDIENIGLENAGEYIGLSYTWGAPSPTSSVKVNACDFNVRENLHVALLHLRLPDKPLRLWVDAICINQDDIREREAQVSIMQHIYHAAKEVVVWIGDDSGASCQRVLQFIPQICARARSWMAHDRIDATQDGFSSANLSQTLEKDILAWIESVTPLGMADSIWLDVTAFLGRPWFSRIWIVQEVVMGATVTVHCGQARLDWMDLFYCSLFIDRFSGVIQQIAGPDCLKHHDLPKYQFYGDSKPAYHLHRVAENIKHVGYLRMKRQLRNVAQDMFRSHIDGYLATHSDPNETCNQIVGILNIQEGRCHVLHLASSFMHDTGRATGLGTSAHPLNDSVSDPYFVNQLEQQIGGGLSLGSRPLVIDGGIPVYIARPKKTSRSAGLESHVSMYTLVRNFIDFDASDPRDKIYALVGLASEVEGIPRLPSISYEASILDAFWNLILSELQGCGKLEFLSDACGIDRPGGFPSWMPLWHRSIDKSTPASFKDFEQTPHIVFHASERLRSRWTATRSTNVLTLDGAFVGRIEKLGDVYDRDLPQSAQSSILTRWATMLGVGEMEEESSRLARAMSEEGMSYDECSTRLSEYRRRRPIHAALHSRFIATLLASVSQNGVGQIMRPSPDLATKLSQMLINGEGAHKFVNFETFSEYYSHQRLAGICHSRRFFMCGYAGGRLNIGLCPRNAKEGDIVALFPGSDLLHIIREAGRVGGRPAFGLVGDAYVNEWMDGELVKGLQSAKDPNGFNTIAIQLL